MEDARITTIIVDTSAIHAANSDFLGIKSELLPSFYDALKEKGIVLLSHPVLDGEIAKHLSESSLVKNKNELVGLLVKTENLLRQAGCYDENLVDKIKAYDIKTALFNKYVDIHKDSVKLDYPKWEDVFKKYFQSVSPFAATGKKKEEFPDAVIIESTKAYMAEHVNDILLVVSKDDDWESAFKDCDDVQVVKSIEEAISIINKVDCILSPDMMSDIFDAAYDEMKSDLEFALECELYDVPEYEFESDFEIDSVKVKDINSFFVPLKVERNTLLFQTEVDIIVSGSGVILDEDRSVWDSEEKEYWLKAFADLYVQKGVATVKAEILVEFDFDNPSEVSVSKTKLVNVGCIDIISEKYSIDPIDSDKDMGEIYDALEGHLPN